MVTTETWLERERRTRWDVSQRAPLTLPGRFANATPQLVPVQALRDVIRNYCVDFDRLAGEGQAPAFFGRAETWKTYSAACVARWVHARARLEVEFVDAGVTFLELENQRFSDRSTARIHRLSTVAFLVLDDLTTPMLRQNSVAEAFLNSVVCTRFAEKLPTLFTGNFKIDTQATKFVERFGPALDRRIRTGSRGLLVVTA